MVFDCGKELSPPFQALTLQPPIWRVNQRANNSNEREAIHDCQSADCTQREVLLSHHSVP
jgi:hypothetical protein